MPLFPGWPVWLISVGKWAPWHCTQNHLCSPRYSNQQGRSGGAKEILVLGRQFNPGTEAGERDELYRRLTDQELTHCPGQERNSRPAQLRDTVGVGQPLS